MITEEQAIQEIKEIGLPQEQEELALRILDDAVNALDLDLFVQYVRLRHLVRDFATTLNESGVVVINASGSVKVHPGVAALERLARLAERLHKRLDIAGLKVARL